MTLKPHIQLKKGKFCEVGIKNKSEGILDDKTNLPGLFAQSCGVMVPAQLSQWVLFFSL